MVKYDISQCWIADKFMPVLYGELVGDQGGSKAMSMLQDFQEVMALVLSDLCQAPIIKDQQVSLGVSREQFPIAPISFRSSWNSLGSQVY